MAASLGLVVNGTVGCAKFLARHRLLKVMSSHTIISRGASGYWNHDWKPGPYPKTKEERERAAKRYGLLPEDYEPYPDDGNAPGDYPNLPPYSANHRDLFEPYEHRMFTRYFGEPMNLNAELYRLGYVDPNNRDYWYWRVPYWKQLLTFVGVLLGAAALMAFGERYKYWPPVMAKQFPYDKQGRKHYLFEPADE